ncbi:glycosyl hydrolase family 3 N terminal domain-containing protein [Aspergillus germanicus]
MKVLSLALAAALLGITGTASASSSTQGILKANGVSLADWQTAYDKASAFISTLSTTQKLSLITGSSITTPNATFTALTFLDGDMGPQNDFYVSAFSLSSSLAMTFDRDAIYAQARAVGEEFYGKGVQVVAGPTSQPLGRTPWGGRNVEGFGPDPYLNGVATGVSTRAYVDAGVIPGAKHFLLNEQETNRTSSGGGGGGGMGGGGGGPGMGGDFPGNSTASASGPGGAAPSGSPFRRRATTSSTSESESESAPYSSNADDKTIHETYLWPFYDAVKNGLGAVMCAMTKVNGTMSCENANLLMKNLKTELGFPGMVWPDMNGQSTAQGSALGGEDYGSSSIWSTETMQALLSNGTLSQARLDDMAIRNVIAYYYVGLDDGEQPEAQATNAYVDVRANHSRLIREKGAKSLALLKNTNNALPLSNPRVMSIFGAHAGPALGGPNQAMNVQGSGPTYQGHLASGTGSGQASLPYVIDAHMALVMRAAPEGTMLRWIMNDTYSSTGSTLIPSDATSTSAQVTYANYATGSDVCLVFLNALSGEGADRTELLVDQWIEHENVTALLYGSVLGQESGNSIVDVLYGDVNPSGRLAYTIAKNESDYNVGLCYTAQCDFTEGVYLDYRHFDAEDLTPRYPFGHGLSYTTFAYSSLRTKIHSSVTRTPQGTPSVGGPSDLWDTIGTISARITNNGTRAGAEIPQLYISFPKEAEQPVRQLRGFEREHLEKREEGAVRFELNRRDVSYWSVEEQEWVVAAGKYKVFVGASSRDFRLRGEFVVKH